ncbi:MAG: thioredoxin family protein [Chitinophagaceae bacterium]|nr:thioredoxin family protein [Chitinophagaceae bacterium]
MAVEIVKDEQFKEMLQKNDKVVVKYFADWCGSCKLFSPKFKRLSDDQRFLDVKFLDVNAEQNLEARKMASVNNLPYFAVFKNGQLIDGSATSKEEVVLELLEKLN